MFLVCIQQSRVNLRESFNSYNLQESQVIQHQIGWMVLDL